MDAVFAWPPIVWLTRLLAFLMLGGLTVVVILLLIRLGRRESWSAIVSGELPRLKTMRLFGQEFDVGEKMDSIRDEEIAALKRQVESLIALTDTEERDGDATNE